MKGWDLLNSHISKLTNQKFSPTEWVVLGVSFVLIFVALTDVVTISLLLGNSMEPTIENGAIAVVDGTSSVETGDIVVYKHPKTGYLVGHRIVAEEPEGYILKGDGNKQIDMVLVQDSDIKGEVVGHIRIPLPEKMFWKVHPEY